MPGTAHSQVHQEARLAARAAARRARSSDAANSMGDLTPGCLNVLVFDPATEARDALCRQLEQFGFCAYPARDVDQARWLAETQPFAAAILDLRFDAEDLGDCLDLCDQVKWAGFAHGDGCALIVSYDPGHATDRIRALLVGGDAILAKPAGRGELVRALEASRIALPSDARRA